MGVCADMCTRRSRAKMQMNKEIFEENFGNDLFLFNLCSFFFFRM